MQINNIRPERMETDGDSIAVKRKQMPAPPSSGKANSNVRPNRASSPTHSNVTSQSKGGSHAALHEFARGLSNAVPTESALRKAGAIQEEEDVDTDEISSGLAQTTAIMMEAERGSNDPYGSFYKNKDTDPAFIKFDKFFKTCNWDRVPSALRVMGLSYPTAATTYYRFELKDKKWQEFNHMSLPMYFMHKSTSKAVNDFLARYNPETVQRVAEALCELIDVDEMNTNFESIKRVRNDTTKNDLMRTFACAAAKLAVRINMRDA